MARAPIPDLALASGTLLAGHAGRLVPVRGSVLVHEGKILGVTAARKPRARETISAEDKLILPGFVDAHCHSIHLLLRGRSDGLSYHAWLETLMYRALPHYTASDARVAASLFCAEAIRSGITTIGDSTDFGNRADLVEATLSAIGDAGLRAVYFRNFSDRPPKALRANREPASAALAHTEALIARYAGRGRRLTIGVGINEPHFVTAAGFRGAVELAERHQVPVMAHVAEIEADATLEGRNVIDWMVQHRLLSPRLVLAHCVWLGPAQFRKIAAAGAAVTWQPSTNAFLADGIMPLQAAVRAGVTVGLGTDDSNASDHVNMFTEMRTGALLAKLGARDPSAVRAADMLWLATVGGARALGLGDSVGSITPGKAADLVLLDLAPLRPYNDIASALVYQATGTEVETVLVGGRVLMRERQLTTLDERALRKRAQQAAAAIVRRERSASGGYGVGTG